MYITAKAMLSDLPPMKIIMQIRPNLHLLDSETIQISQNQLYLQALLKNQFDTYENKKSL